VPFGRLVHVAKPGHVPFAERRFDRRRLGPADGVLDVVAVPAGVPASQQQPPVCPSPWPQKPPPPCRCTRPAADRSPDPRSGPKGMVRGSGSSWACSQNVVIPSTRAEPERWLASHGAGRWLQVPRASSIGADHTLEARNKTATRGWWFPGSQRPPLPVLVLDEPGGLGQVAGGLAFGVPVDLAPDPVGNVAEQRRFGQGPGVIEIAGGRPVVSDGLDPFAVMTDRRRDGGCGRFEFGEVLFRQELTRV